MLDAVFTLQTLLVALVTFGLAPGLLLRVIVKAFRRDDPRREELLAELHVVPRAERPFWVLEQVEVALADGLWPRMVWAASGRLIYRWHLRSGVKAHAEYPDTFWIPSDEEKAALEPGVLVKLVFDLATSGGERMWVQLTKVHGRRLVGTLVNQPVAIPRLDSGDEIKFTRDHVILIDWESGPGDATEFASEPLCPCCANTRNDPGC